MTVAVVVLVVIALAGYVATGVRQTRAANAKRRAVLQKYEGRRMAVVTETGGRVALTNLVTGVIRSVQRRGVTVERDDGKEVFIPIDGVRGLQDPKGHVLGQWR